MSVSDRVIFQVLSDLARRLEALGPAHGGNGQTVGEADDPDQGKQIKRLSRELFKANTLAEAQLEQTQQALAAVQQALDALRQEQQQQVTQSKLALIKALLPVLDGIEAGLKSGVRQAQALQATSPEAAGALGAWLKGQQLLRERMLKLLEAEGVTPMSSVGQPFDPYRHVAVKKVADPAHADGVIVAEERRGYVHGDIVLRYAEVIVNRNAGS